MIFGNRKKNSIDTPQGLKDEYFDFDRIASYYQWKRKEDCFQSINDHTWADLDMDEVLMATDRTYSKPGQQYLYYLLRTIPTEKRADQIEATIATLENEVNQTKELVSSIKKLNSRGSYFIHSLFTRSILKKPRWFWLIYLLLITTIGSIVGLFFYPPLILVALTCLIANFIIHYWNKSKLMEFSNAISQLYRLNKVCDKLMFIYQSSEVHNELSHAQRALRGIARKASFIRENTHTQSEFSVIFDSVIEILKASTLIEPIMLYQLTDKIENRKKELNLIFESLGFADACLSIIALRKAYNYSIPKYTDKRILKTVNCYHPLIKEPESNSIDVHENRSVLISGSNMSGKTTFIRTLGVNALLGQTINMVFASEWTFPKARIFSAIRISDDLLNDESFYQKEVKVIQEMIEESQSGEMCLFLIDELYKGTNSIERIGAGVAVLNYLHSINSLIFASTHDLELSELLMGSYTNYHFTEQVNQSTIQFDYKLKEGKLQNTNAIRILETNGYPEEITNQAREIAEVLAKKS